MQFCAQYWNRKNIEGYPPLSEKDLFRVLNKNVILQFCFPCRWSLWSSAENPKDVQFVDLKNCNREVKGHRKFCKIVTITESIDSKRKLLLARASK